jgi:hypothetical protein
VRSMSFLSIAVLFAVEAVPADDSRLVVHEWGTFTSFQDEEGKSIGGINTEDEPLPRFVHGLGGYLLIGPIQLPPHWFKGAPACHPDVTMRLETPVIYFHVPSEAKQPISLDVEVAFRGGWLTEFYPAALVDAPGHEGQVHVFGPIGPETIGRLEWRGLQVGTGRTGPETREKVWLSPRAVDAAPVTTPEGESERFLFYRGVGQVEAPLAVSRDVSGGRLLIRSRNHHPPLDGRPLTGLKTQSSLLVKSLWLADVDLEGRVAFRTLPPLEVTRDVGAVLAATPESFQPEEYSLENLAMLQNAMHAALVDDGLFADEARALLDTWEISYFKSLGLRLFFLVPRPWTNDVLPLRISRAADVVRVMVGRIELITPRQRELLAAIGNAPVGATGHWWPQFEDESKEIRFWRDLERGRVNDDLLKVKEAQIPEDYRRYVGLGRFRNALVLAEDARRPNAALRAFIDAYGLEARAVNRRPGGSKAVEAAKR